MVNFPDTSTHRKALQSFLDGVRLMGDDVDDTIEEARAKASNLLKRLDTPVRFAFTGPARSGKTSLINLIVGDELLPTGKRKKRMPPVIVRHGETERTIAQYWDQKEVVFEGRDLNAALGQNPDVITFEVDCEDLKHLWLVDISDGDNPEYEREAIFALIQLADAMVWCSNVSSAWGRGERALWGSIPSKLKRNSILAMTHADLADDTSITHLEDALPSVAAKSFRATQPIATLLAWEAFVGDENRAQEMWEKSGAPEFLGSVVDLAAEQREAEIVSVAKAIAEQIEPLRHRLPVEETENRVVQLYAVKGRQLAQKAKSEETSVPAPEPKQVEAVVPQAVDVATLSNPALENWIQRLAEIGRELAAEDNPETQRFIEACNEVVNDFMDDIAENNCLPDDAEWVLTDLEKASDLLVLMQFEDGEDLAIDAMRILIQLTDSLSWAACKDRGKSKGAENLFVV